MIPRHNGESIDSAQSSISTDELLQHLHELEVYLYHQRIRHIKRISKHRRVMYRMLDDAIHDAYQACELELDYQAGAIRKLQKVVRGEIPIDDLNFTKHMKK